VRCAHAQSIGQKSGCPKKSLEIASLKKTASRIVFATVRRILIPRDKYRNYCRMNVVPRLPGRVDFICFHGFFFSGLCVFFLERFGGLGLQSRQKFFSVSENILPRGQAFPAANGLSLQPRVLFPLPVPAQQPCGIFADIANPCLAELGDSDKTLFRIQAPRMVTGFVHNDLVSSSSLSGYFYSIILNCSSNR